MPTIQMQWGLDADLRAIKAKNSPHILEEFTSVTETEMAQIIMKLGPASSILDPIPTKVIKQVLPILLPDITHIINSSLRSGSVPLSWKKGIVTPLQKKAGGKPNDLTNLRPVSQLRLLPRIAEVIITHQMQKHLETNHLLHDSQSGFRPGRGTELAITDVRERLLWQADQGHPAALVLLDLSAAFDTVDHSILLRRLREVAGVGGRAWDWVESFLTNRSQQVKLGELLSTEGKLTCGVPQGSALSPVLFNIYLRPLADLLEHVGLPCQLYADDTQISVDLHEQSREKNCLVPCLMLVREWMRCNKLRLNNNKTELLIVEGQRGQETPSIPWPSSWGPQPKPVTKVRDLGVYMSSRLDGSAHAATTANACHRQLNALARIFPLLEIHQRVTLYQALVGSRLVYGLTSMIGANQKTLNALQRVQNRGIRLIFGLTRFHHISSYRIKLGWLSIKDTITLKTCLLIHKARAKNSPKYTRAWVTRPTGMRSQRTANKNGLVPPRFFKNTKGGRTVHSCGTRWWNDLPAELKATENVKRFKQHLRKLLLTKATEEQQGQATGLAYVPQTSQEPMKNQLANPSDPQELELTSAPSSAREKGRDTKFPTATTSLSQDMPDNNLTTDTLQRRDQATIKGLSSPQLPYRYRTDLIQLAAANKTRNKANGGAYAPRRITTGKL